MPPTDFDADIEAAIEAAAALLEHARNHPIDNRSWTPPQEEILCSTHPRRLFRAGSQFGKSETGAYDTTCVAQGEHPFRRVRPPPTENRVYCTTWQQSVAIMLKYEKMIPKHLIDEYQTSNFTSRWGFGKDNPTVTYKNGSVIKFRTSAQGPRVLESETVHNAHVDELCSHEVYSTIERRLLQTGGSLLATLTPLHLPADWLRELVRQGVFHEVHARLTVPNLTPRGWTHPLSVWDERLQRQRLMDARWIAEQWATVLPFEAPVKLDGEWEYRSTDRIFTAWDPDSMISADLPEGEVDLVFGMDHGEGDFREAAVLACVETGEYPRVHVIDEYFSDGRTTTAQDAEGVADMFRRNGLRWSDLSSARGDKPTTGKIGRKSNLELSAELSRVFRRWGHLVRNQELKPPIWTAKTGTLGVGNKTLWRGCEWLHRAMVRRDFAVHPRCTRLIESIEKWAGETTSEYKDAIDALRYATWNYAIRGNLRLDRNELGAPQ